MSATALLTFITPTDAQMMPSPSPAPPPLAFRYALANDTSSADAIKRDASVRLTQIGATNVQSSVPCHYTGARAAYRCFIVPGYKVYVGIHPFGDNSSIVAGPYSAQNVIGWAPAQQVENGATRYAQLLGMADSRTLTGCANGGCTQVVHTYRRPEVSNTVDIGADILSVCSVTQAGTAVGPPSGCWDAAFARGGVVYLKAVLAQEYPARPIPLATGVPTPLPTATPAHAPRPSDLLDNGETVAMIVRGGRVSDTEVMQATCNALAVKQIFCGGRGSAVAGYGSRFFTTSPQWFEQFNLSMAFGTGQFGSNESYSVSLNLSDLVVSPRAGDGFAAAPPQLAQLYRRNVVVIGKSALFGLCRRHNIMLGSESDERPTVFDCYR